MRTKDTAAPGADIVREFIYFDAGLPHWRVNPGPTAQGRIAGCIRNDGFRYVGLLRQYWRAQDLAWVLATHVWPAAHERVCHRDGNADNNAIENLVLLPVRDALDMRRVQRHGQHLGVCIVAPGVWQAQVWDGTRTQYLGRFPTEEAAYAAYKIADAQRRSK